MTLYGVRPYNPGTDCTCEIGYTTEGRPRVLTDPGCSWHGDPS